MNWTLKVYTDETLTEVKRTAEADELRIPYRVAISLISCLENTDLKNDTDLIRLLGGSTDKLDKIMKATFKLSESELDCVNATELVGVATQLYKWAMEKIESIKDKNSKNSQTAV